MSYLDASLGKVRVSVGGVVNVVVRGCPLTMTHDGKDQVLFVFYLSQAKCCDFGVRITAQITLSAPTLVPGAQPQITVFADNSRQITVFSRTSHKTEAPNHSLHHTFWRVGDSTCPEITPSAQHLSWLTLPIFVLSTLYFVAAPS